MLLKREEEAIFKLRQLYADRGYKPFKMSRFEEYDLYLKNKEFLVSDRVITFQDQSGRLMALKPDVTLSIVKNAPDEKGVVQKLYYNESVYRADKDFHDFREVMQTGLECVGDLQKYHIWEVVLLALRSLSALDRQYILDISHMGLLEVVLCDVPLQLQKAVARCLQQKNLHDLTAMCGDLHQSVLRKLTYLIENSGTASTVLSQIKKVLDKPEELEAIDQLEEVLKIIDACGFADKVRVDFSVVNGMGYYNGLVMRGYIAGIPDAVLSGGQYDKLPSRLGKDCRAIGFAVYLDLLERLSAHQSEYDVDILLLCNNPSDSVAFQMAVESLMQEGSVLVCSQIPKNALPRKIYTYQNGEVLPYEGNA